MARDSDVREREFIERAAETTGHTVEAWIEILDNSEGGQGRNAIIKHLKTEHRLNHMQANYLVGIYLNNGQPVYDYAVLFAKLFDGHEHWRPIYDRLVEQVGPMFENVVFVPTRTYVSIEGEKIFGCVKLTKKTVRLGLDLGDAAFEGRVQKAKGLGAMPNITHMIELTTVADVDDFLLQNVRRAFDRVHS
jgi:hypothetical protein